MPYVQANTHGRLHSAAEAVVSPLDRGFLYGDAVYEVWRTYHDTVFAFEEHWARLEASARSLHLTLPLTAAQGWLELRRTVAAFREQSAPETELYIRLQVSRGGGPIGLDPALAEGGTWVFLVQDLPRLSPEKARAGLRVIIPAGIRRNHPSTLNPLWKTGNYLNNVLALREARVAGADEGLMLNLAGEITEASTMNIAFVREGRLVTPPLSAGILAGITRHFLLREIAPRAAIPAAETTVLPANLAGMDEAFFLSTTRDIAPIAAIDHHVYRVDQSSVTSRLKHAFADFAREYAAARPERRLS